MGRKEFFEARISEFQSEVEAFEAKFKRISYIRLVVIISLISAFIYFANSRDGVLMSVIAVLTPIVFGLLVKWHNGVRYKRDKARALVQLNQDEILKSKLELAGFDEGKEYVDPEHPYSSDLDIFGQHSLFQLLNRTNTGLGRDKLAQWLINSATSDEIKDRQSALSELSQRPEWIQDLISEGKVAGDHQKSVEALLTWLEDQEKKPSTAKLALPVVLALTLLSCLVLVSNDVFSWGFLLFPIGLNVLFLSFIFKKLKDISEVTYEGAKALKGYRMLISKMANTEFSSKLLIELQSQFKSENIDGEVAIGKLNRLLDILTSRINSFYILFNLTFMMDYFLDFGLSSWKNKYGSKIREWFDALAEIEVLVSMAGYQYANDSYAQPLISDQPFELSAKEMGHPLIPEKVRVNNDIEISGEGTAVVITGSNMSGKSTFLRTVGINMVLAYSGGVACSSAFSTSMLGLFTSMRTSDKLEESISSFYAELKRLKSLIDWVENDNRPTMYMVDEVLKGTNSSDRHIGAKSLITQLSTTPSIGWVSTHDLALGELANSNEKVVNMSFNSRLEDDELIFDYKISAGVCHTFNASVLMRKMGIRLLEE